MAIEPNQNATEGPARRTELHAQAHDTAVDFLWSELDVADTLVSVAETTSSYETAARNLNNAWLALQAAQEYAERLDLGSGERRAFRDLHGALCLRLTELHIRAED